MNELTRIKLAELVKKKIVTQIDFFDYFKRPTNTKLKNMIKKQYDFSVDNLTKFKVVLFDSWKDVELVFPCDEIIVIVQILNNCGVITRKDLLKLTKLTSHKLGNAIEGLYEEGLIDYIMIEQNEKLFYICNENFKEMVNKYGK